MEVPESILERNLAALAVHSEPATRAIRAAEPATSIEWVETDDGLLAARLEGRWLCSKRRPSDEADRFASALDPSEVGAAVITGFGVGHHVRATCEAMGRGGAVLCFEPDAALLRAVLERVDCSSWIRASNLAVLVDESDASMISQTLRGSEGVVALGIKLMHHQPSAPRLGQRATVFCEAFGSIMQATKTSVITTLMQTETTLRNLLCNADWYAGAPDAGELAGVAQGRAAVVVSAGPSLARNLHLLKNAAHRERVVVIAVQTVLKPMLAEGIRPDFVVSVDYHEISRRFFEGLTEADVRGITLVCDPKANPVVCESFPGAVRTLHDPVLQGTLKSVCEHSTTAVPPSATVAHLAYSLARLLGCDPVILIGQDLGFSDGLYYGPGAAIHEVWAPEVHPLRTLESLEWERIARGRPNGRTLEDVNGRAIHTDEQMHSYLVQFERMFNADAQRGLAIIDATEGGVRKRHTQPMALAEALDRWAGDDLDPITLPSTQRDDDARLAAAKRVAAHLDSVRNQTETIARVSRETGEMLGEMLEANGDQRVIAPLVERAHANGRRASALEPGYSLVQYLNQTGSLKRFKADRDLHYATGLSETDRQRGQIERDAMNVSWLADAADQLAEMLNTAATALRTGDKPTEDPRDAAATETEDSARGARALPKIAAVLAVDPDESSLGRPRDLARPIAGRENALQRTLRRLSQTSIGHAVLLTQHPERVRTLLGELVNGMDGLAITIEAVDGHPLGEKRAMVASARRVAPWTWRGGLGGASVYDEVFSAPAFAEAMDRHGLDAAVICGCDWIALDPELTDRCVRRHAEAPSRNRLVFTQAAPGLSPLVIDRSLCEELAANEGTGRLLTSVAGLLGYVPVAPSADLIARSACVRIDPALRDIPIRCIADGSWHGSALAQALDDRSAQPLAERLARGRWRDLAVPSDVTLELCSGRLVGSVAASHRHGRADPPERQPLDGDAAMGFLRQLAELSPGATLTLAGAGDPLMHPQWLGVARAAREHGLGVHVRTDLVTDDAVALVLEARPDVVSVDLYANNAEAYARVAGLDRFDRVERSLIELIERRDAEAPEMWVVPRITRCDEVLDQIEPFYDRWLMAAGACVIDRPWKGTAGADSRVQPLPLPRLADMRRSAWGLRVRSDLVASIPGMAGRVSLAQKALAEAWQALRRAGRRERVAA